MDKESRKILELFVEEAEDLAKYIAKNNCGGLMGIYRKGEREIAFAA